MVADLSRTVPLTLSVLMVTTLSGTLAAHAAPPTITIKQAVYGDNCPHANATGTNVTAHIASECNGKTACDYLVNHLTIGDPALFCQKAYRVVYSCGRGDIRQAGIGPEASGKVVQLACTRTTATPEQPAPSRVSPKAAPPTVENTNGRTAKLTLEFVNKTGFTLAYGYYTADGSREWPPKGSIHVAPGKSSTITIDCTPNESICMGARALEDTDYEWGVGLMNDTVDPTACVPCEHGKRHRHNIHMR